MSTKPMHTGSTRRLETPVREATSTLTDEYPTALATLVRADRASHDVAQAALRDLRAAFDDDPVIKMYDTIEAADRQ